MRKIHWEFPVTASSVREVLPRAQVSIDSVSGSVQHIIDEVRYRGLEAITRHAREFDQVVPKDFRVSPAQLAKAADELEPDLRSSIELAIERVRRVSQAQLPDVVATELAPGGVVTTRYVPVDSVGLYVPGGKAVYPSSAIMNVVPAQVAQVPRIVICSPAQLEYDGLPHPSILATAHLLGVDEVYAIGGASAVAAFAYGIPEIGFAPTRLVTGPGNIYVAAAKRLLRSVIGIDSEAGPTEILIIADKTANPRFVAADLISQAEHDENAASVLVTDSQELLDEVIAELERQVAGTANKERVQAALAGVQSAAVLVPSIEVAVAIANEYATEHLEIHTSDAQAVANQISNAGAIFVGDYSPVSLGDYIAGSNHVLPTGEQAKFSAGLNVLSFLRSQQVISYDKTALFESMQRLVTFSHAEGLPAHGDAAAIRFEN